MKQMMERAGNSHLLTILSYPGAGHLIEPPYSPHCRASNFMLAETRTKGKPTKCVLKFQKTTEDKFVMKISKYLLNGKSQLIPLIRLCWCNDKNIILLFFFNIKTVLWYKICITIYRFPEYYFFLNLLKNWVQSYFYLISTKSNYLTLPFQFVMAIMVFVAVVVLWGGQTEPHSRAQEDSWHKTLAFLEQHLYSNMSH